MTEHATPDGPAPSAAPEWTNQGENVVFANALTINGGAFDVMLVFGRQDQPIPVVPNSQPPVTEVVRVGMSWGHAKSMIPLLARMVAQYEERFGAVPAPGFDENWRA